MSLSTGLPSSSFHSFQVLQKGNQRFIRGIRSVDVNFAVERMKEVAEKGQSPQSIVITCSDSRVPVETLFDLGVGEVFVIRVAGNVISSDVIASVEYAALQFGTPLCVVMGHTSCGAVRAAIQYAETGKCGMSIHGRKLLQKILPSAHEAIQCTQKAAHSLEQVAILMNVSRNKSLLIKRSPVISKLISEQKFAVVEAIYDLQTGRVAMDSETLLHATQLSESILSSVRGVA